MAYPFSTLLFFLLFALHAMPTHSFPHISLPLQRYVGYNMNISIGQPAQRMFVELDTGFEYLVLPGPNHVGCGSLSFPCYDESRSSSVLIPLCDEMPIALCNQSYCTVTGSECIPSVNSQLFNDDGLWRWRSDVISLTATASARVVFLLWLSTPLRQPISFGGDFGFAWPTLHIPALPVNTSFVASLYRQHIASSGVLSITLSKFDGEVEFGGSAPQSAQWLPLVRTPLGYYYATASKVVVGSVDLISGHQEPLWTGPDTGTLAVTVPQNVLTAFHHFLIAEYCQKGVPLVGVCNLTSQSRSLFAGACFPMTADDIALFPTLQFQITSWNNNTDSTTAINLSWSSELYLSNNPIATLRHNCTAGNYALMMMGNAGQTGIVLGSPLLRNYATLFDFNLMQFGWGKA